MARVLGRNQLRRITTSPSLTRWLAKLSSPSHTSGGGGGGMCTWLAAAGVSIVHGRAGRSVCRVSQVSCRRRRRLDSRKEVSGVAFKLKWGRRLQLRSDLKNRRQPQSRLWCPCMRRRWRALAERQVAAARPRPTAAAAAVAWHMCRRAANSGNGGISCADRTRILQPGFLSSR